jgi:hypothetical protein
MSNRNSLLGHLLGVSFTRPEIEGGIPGAKSPNMWDIGATATGASRVVEPIEEEKFEPIFRWAVPADIPSPLVTLTTTRADYNAPGGPDWSGRQALNHFLRGRLVYAAGGASETVDFDWLQGTMICVPATRLDVYCSYRPISGGAGTIAQTVGVLLSPGARPASGSTSIARYTSDPFEIPAVGVGIAEVLVPNRAHAVRLYVSDEAAYGAFIANLAQGDVGNYQVRPTGPDEVAMPNATNRLQLVNTTATPIVGRAVFSLAL